MGRIILILVIFFLIMVNIDTRAFKAKTIDLKIKDDEVDVVFVRLKDSISLLINDEDDSNLFVIKYRGDNGLKEVLHIFKSNPNIFYLNKNIDKIIDNIHVFKYKNFLKFRINNYTLCINDRNIKTCDFVYLLDLNKSFRLNENILNVFYDESLNEKYLRSLEESWIDKTIVSSESFTILKINEENYNILVVPSTNE